MRIRRSMLLLLLLSCILMYDVDVDDDDYVIFGCALLVMEIYLVQMV